MGKKKAEDAPKVEKKEKPKSIDFNFNLETKRAKKDKDAPKKGISAFFFYQKTRRESLKKEQPKLENKMIISTMSAEWRKFDDTDKEKYQKMADEDKSRYEKEKKEYDIKKKTNHKFDNYEIS